MCYCAGYDIAIDMIRPILRDVTPQLIWFVLFCGWNISLRLKYWFSPGPLVVIDRKSQPGFKVWGAVDDARAHNLLIRSRIELLY